MLRKIYYKLPPQYRFMARRFFYLPIDVFEKITKVRPPMTPPRGYIYTGSGDYVQGGNKWLIFFKKQDLQPYHQFLDIGSGIGRIARPLTGFLDKTGKYEGFDAVKLGVDWCKKNIESQHPNFHFQYIPLANDLYRPDGEDATRLRFPYPDSQFDFTVLISVFTHMLPDEVSQYLNEIHRVLAKNGTCVATFFILNDTIITNKGFQFFHQFGHYALMDADVKAANVAFQQAYLEQIIEESGLALSGRIDGFWRTGIRGNETQDFQDILVLHKI